PLPGRENIVLTRRRDYARQGVCVARSVDEALRMAAEYLSRVGGEEVMVIGGEEVYRQFLSLASRFYLTVLEGTFPGTAVFPREWHKGRNWHVTVAERFAAEDGNAIEHCFYQIDESAEPRDILPAPFGD